MRSIAGTDLLPETGSTLPTAPVIGQLFLHTPTGRKILYEYDGANWQPLRAYGTITLYADYVNGTDDLLHGTASGASAFKTIPYTINSIPPTLDGKVDIYLAACDFGADDMNFGSPKAYVGIAHPQTNGIYVHGTLTKVADIAITGGVKGAAAVLPSVTMAAGGGAYDNLLLKFTSGANNGLYRVIDSDDATHLYLCGDTLTAIPANGDTAEVYDWGTVVNSITVTCVVPFITIYDVKTDGYIATAPIPYSLTVDKYSALFAHRCSIPFISGALIAAGFSTYASCELYNCLLVSTEAGWVSSINVLQYANLYLSGIKLLGNAGNTKGIFLCDYGTVWIDGGSVIDGFWIGVGLNQRSYGDSQYGTCYSIIRNNTLYGISAGGGSSYLFTANVTFAANGTNTIATAASYSYIGAAGG